jgi:hypothetical protein
MKKYKTVQKLRGDKDHQHSRGCTKCVHHFFCYHWRSMICYHNTVTLPICRKVGSVGGSEGTVCRLCQVIVQRFADHWFVYKASPVSLVSAMADMAAESTETNAPQFSGNTA